MMHLTLLGLLLAPVQAQPPELPQGPADLELPYATPLDSEEDAARYAADIAQLDRSLGRARAVFIGEVLSVRPDPETLNQSSIATVEVAEQLKGQVPTVLDVALPLGSGWRTGRAPAVKGYRLLLFLNESDTLLNSGALYLVMADHLWRNRDDSDFLNPVADREWTGDIDPSQDYIVIPLAEARARAALVPKAEAPRRRWWQRLFGSR